MTGILMLVNREITRCKDQGDKTDTAAPENNVFWQEDCSSKILKSILSPKKETIGRQNMIQLQD